MKSRLSVLLVVLPLLCAVSAGAQTTTVSVQCSCPDGRMAHMPPGTNCAAWCGVDTSSITDTLSSTASSSSSDLSTNMMMANTLAQGLTTIFGAIGQARVEAKQRRIEEQKALQARIRESRQREQAQFERSKQATLSMMKGSSPSSMGLKAVSDLRTQEQGRLTAVAPGIQAHLASLLRSFGVEPSRREPLEPREECDDVACLSRCPTVEGAMGTREVDAGCVRQCAELSCPDSPAAAISLPADWTESQYFYDLQMRETMPPLTERVPAVDRLARPGEMSWQTASAEVVVDRTAYERLEGLRSTAAENTVAFVAEESLDALLEKLPGAGTLKSTLKTMVPLANETLTNAFDALRVAPAIAYGDPEGAVAARLEAGSEALGESFQQAAHDELLGSVAGKVWQDQLREAVRDDLTGRWTSAFRPPDGDSSHTFHSESVFALPEHADAYRTWQTSWWRR